MISWKLITLTTAVLLSSLFQSDAHAVEESSNQINSHGNCVTAVNGSYINVTIVNMTCISGPRPPIDTADPRALVITDGRWWASFFETDRNGNFGNLKSSYELPDQEVNASQVSRYWHRGQRPEGFTQSPAIPFGAKIYGERYFEQGTYCFQLAETKRNDSHRVYLGDALILDKWGYNSNIDARCVRLDEGFYPIEVHYWHTTNSATLGVFWRREVSL